MVVLLMSGGADPCLRDGEGYAAIHLAVQFARSDIASYLLAKGCDPDLRDKNGMTPLMWACLRVYTYDPTRYEYTGRCNSIPLTVSTCSLLSSLLVERALNCT